MKLGGDIGGDFAMLGESTIFQGTVEALFLAPATITDRRATLSSDGIPDERVLEV